MFSVSVAYDRDPERALEWLRGEGITPVRSLGSDPANLLSDLRAGRLTEAPITHLRFDVDREYSTHLRQLDPPRLRERLETAVQRVLSEAAPGASGAFNVRFEGPKADPRAYALLLPRESDRGGARLFSRADIHGLEAAWDRELQRTFGVRREVDRLGLPEDRVPSSPEARRVRELDARWRHAVGQVREAVASRMHGRIPQERLRAVVERAQELQDRLSAARQVLEGRSPMPVIGAVRLKVERGGEYLARLPEATVDRVLLQATREASGLDPRNAASLRVIAYRSGPDLRLTVFQSDADCPASPVDFQAVGQRLEARLASELMHTAGRLHPLGREGGSVPGRVELLGPQVSSRTMPEPPAAVRSERHVARSPIVVEYRLVHGAVELARLDPKRQAEILDHAALRAFPFLTGDGQREIQASSEGHWLRVRIALPADGVWRRVELQHGAFEARFVNEVSRQLSLETARQPNREAVISPIPTNGAARGSELHPEDRKFARLVCAKVLSGEADRDPMGFAEWIRTGLRSYQSRVPFGHALREGLKEVRRGMDTPLTDVWARLCQAVPPPMRAAYVFTRTIGRIIPRE